MSLEESERRGSLLVARDPGVGREKHSRNFASVLILENLSSAACSVDSGQLHFAEGATVVVATVS